MHTLILAPIVLAALAFPASAQSGRKAKERPVLVPDTPAASPTPSPSPSHPQLTAEKNEDYHCSDDGTLVRVVEEENNEEIFTSKAVEVKANILDKPRAQYTREARRAGIQGVVVLRVVLRANGQIGTIRVLRALPAGLTANAMQAACKIKFKPALKNGNPVSQFLNVEYGFRLADSSIYGP